MLDNIGTDQRIETLAAIPTNGNATGQYHDVRVFADMLLDSLDRSPETVKAYRKGVSYFLAWVAEQGITNPVRADVKRYKDYVTSEYKASTAASYIAAVRWLFKSIAQEAGKPELNIASGIRTPKPPQGHQRDALSADQAKTILAAMPLDTLAQKRDKAIVTLTLFCGLRVVEVTRADVSDIRNTPKGAVMDIWGKGRDGKGDPLPIHSTALETLNDYLKARELADGKLEESSPLFASLSRRDYGQRMAVRSVSRICKKAISDYVLDSPRLTAHSLRHTSINLVIENGGTLYEAQQHARHRDPATTEVYIHENETAKRDAANRIGAALAV